MRGRLQMSDRERQRIGPLARVIQGEITLATAVVQMGICYRQGVRVLKRYRGEGDAGLIHRSCGRTSPRRTDPGLKEAVLELVRTKYPDFGPTLASEKLSERDGKQVNRETLRRWLIASGSWQPRKSRQKHRSQRKRKACFGEMLQMDGSRHAWYEDRGSDCFLMNLVDDATGAAMALFSEEETTWAAMDLLEKWVRRFGIPASIYVDRKNVYVTEREQTPQEQLAAMPALTQFGRACHKLGIRIIKAHSPQAKGRVERKHGVFQDRLIKEMRLEGIAQIEAANVFLPAWLDKSNERFAVAPRCEVDMHRPVAKELDLRAVFCLERERSLGMDYTVRYKSQWLQVTAQKELPAPRSRVRVQEGRDGSLHLYYNDRELNYRLLDAPHQRPKPAPQKGEVEEDKRLPVIPAEDHPWRRTHKPAESYVNPRHVPELVNQLADTYLSPPHLGT